MEEGGGGAGHSSKVNVGGRVSSLNGIAVPITGSSRYQLITVNPSLQALKVLILKHNSFSLNTIKYDY